MSLLFLFHVANFILPSLGDLRSVNLEQVSTLWGVDGSIWWPLLRIVFRKAKTVQVVRLPTSGNLEYSLWTDLIPNVQHTLGTSVTVWNASTEDIIHGIRHVNPSTKHVRTFLLLVGSDYLQQLTRSRIWYAQSKYIILVEQSDKCTGNFSFLFHRQGYLAPDVFFVLSSCPEFAYLVKADEPNSSVVLGINNVTAVISKWIGDCPPTRNSTVKVTMFHRYPTFVETVTSENCTYFEGIDGFFLEAFCKHHEFRPVVLYPDDGQTYGEYENGTATGTLGMVLRGEADIALNGRFLIDYGTREISHTKPYLTDRLCIMVPSAKKVPSYIAMFRCFDRLTWTLQLSAYIIGCIVWTFITRFDNKSRVKYSVPLDVYFMLIAGSFSKSSPFSQPARLFIASCLIFCLVFMGAFQGLLYQSMTSPTYYPDLNTMADVDRSGLPIVTGSPSLMNAFPADDEDPLIQRLRSKLSLIRNEALWSIIKVDNSNYATLWRKNGAFLRLYQRNRTLHLVQECPRFHFLSFLTQKNSPYRQLVNKFIERCTEHGLMELWRERTYKFTAKDLHRRQKVDHNLTVALLEVEPAFFSLSIGLASSAVVFVYETIKRRRKAGRSRVVAVPPPKKTRLRYVPFRVSRFVRRFFIPQHRQTRIPFRQ